MKYRETHNHLGEPVSTERQPWRIADLVVCAFLIGFIAALLSGVLT